MGKIFRDNEDRFASLGILGFMVFFIASISIYRYYSLRDCYCTFATYNGVKGSGVGSRNTILFKDYKDKSYEAEISMDVDIKIGDTIWIKYSKNDPTVVEVLDLNYKKHLKNKKCN